MVFDPFDAIFDQFDPAKCTDCKLGGNGMHAYSRKHRGIGRKVMFVGEAPGEQEGKKHLAFVGNSGKLLDEWIGKMLVTNYVITNAVRHRPVTPQGANRTPGKDEIKACGVHLESEIASENPKFIIYLGKSALKTTDSRTVTMKQAIMHSLIDPYWYGTTTVLGLVVYHPAYILRKHWDMTPLLEMVSDIIMNPPERGVMNTTVSQMLNKVVFPA